MASILSTTLPGTPILHHGRSQIPHGFFIFCLPLQADGRIASRRQIRQESDLSRYIMDSSREALDGDNSDGYIVVRKKKGEKVAAAAVSSKSGPEICWS